MLHLQVVRGCKTEEKVNSQVFYLMAIKVLLATHTVIGAPNLNIILAKS